MIQATGCWDSIKESAHFKEDVHHVEHIFCIYERGKGVLIFGNAGVTKNKEMLPHTHHHNLLQTVLRAGLHRATLSASNALHTDCLFCVSPHHSASFRYASPPPFVRQLPDVSADFVAAGAGGGERRDLHVSSSGGDTGHFASCVHKPHTV